MSDLAPTVTEQADLVELEQQIEHGLQSFVQVGLALASIRDRRLYRAQYERFEDYLRERWQFGLSHGYRLIDAARVAEAVSPIGETQPTGESQMRPLVGLDLETQQEAWQQATAGGKQPTAEEVEQITRAVLAGLTPDKQRQVVEAEEKKEIERARRHEEAPEDRHAKRLRRDVVAVRKIRGDFAREGEATAAIVERLDSVIVDAEAYVAGL